MAMEAIEAGELLCAVANFYGIPKTSLSDHVHGRTRTRKRGPTPLLKQEEEQALDNIKMTDYGHPLTSEELRLKVALLTQERVTSFKDGIPGNSWFTWFKKRHPNLTTRQSQELEYSRTKDLCAEKVASFYQNLQQLYDKHKYPPENIWNCNDSDAQAGKTRGGQVWVQKGVRSVYKIAPNEQEHITTLTCINATGQYIPNFYIFKGKRIRANYIQHCENQAAMAMQPQAWLTQFLFRNWLSHFIQTLGSRGGISNQNRHLLIVDGHNSHVIVDVVLQAMKVVLDVLTFPSHTSHRLQPLDVGVFAPYKRAFKRYRDAWIMHYPGCTATKQILAMWVSYGLQRAPSRSNIEGGFRGTRVWPYNEHTVDNYLGPS